METQSKRTRRGGPAGLLAALILVVSVTAVDYPSSAVSAGETSPAPRFLGPVLSVRENGDTSYGRDGGFSVPLGNRSAFWIFGDSPRWRYVKGKWRLRGFVPGSTAAIAQEYTPNYLAARYFGGSA